MAKGTDYLQEYLGDIRRQLATGVAAEHAYRPALKRLLEAHRARIVAVNDPRRVDCGAPDFIVQKGKAPLGYVECKDIGADLAKVLKTDQLKRYLESLENLIVTDYLEFRWFVHGAERLTARIAVIDPKGKCRADAAGQAELIALLDAFFDADVPIVTSPKQLAQRMAGLAKLMREIIANAFADEAETGTLHEQMAGFRDVLLGDLTPAQFADMYAQTICYGLFAAIVHSAKPHEFNREHAAWDLPPTNPFLREMFTHIAGPSLDARIVWAVDDLAELLRRADIHAILADFGRATRRDDPVVHFYETFLAAYDPKMRESRGVYYTPEPVVSYIVRSIDHILKTDFGLPDGLADATKIDHAFTDPMTGKKARREVHKVQILDPATGTGTFLHGVVAAIYEKFAGNEGLWDQYVREHLLPRLFGFELLMAPYAVAHMKLGLQLRQTGYTFASDERLNVFLTNTLEEAEHHAAGLFAGLIAKEANEASRVKRDTPVMVVLGNPPYSNFGRMNRNEWILGLLDDYKKGLNEKKLNIDDDFIKFFKFAQHRIEQTGYGILAFISNNTYIDGITHRRMRESLMETFDDIYILNLHGNSRRGEVCPDGSPDENVFDIQQGTAIAILVKKPEGTRSPAKVVHAELWGLRGSKYAFLHSHSTANTEWQVIENIGAESCLGQFFFYEPKAFDNIDEYCLCAPLQTAISAAQNAVKTDRDLLFLDMSRDVLNQRMQVFYSPEGLDSPFADEYGVRNTSSYDLLGKRAVTKYDSGNVLEFLYRPYDKRWIYYSPDITSRHGYGIMRHMLAGQNLGLIGSRQTKDQWDVLAVNTICGHKSCSAYDINTLFPLYLYPGGEGKKGKLLLEDSPWPAGPGGRRPNLSAGFVAELAGKVGLEFVPDGCGDLEKTFGPEDVFHYMYAVFHCPTYRSRYAELLKIDFPRLPLTSDVKLFGRLCGLGAELVGLHLLEAVPAPAVNFPARGGNTVEKVRYVDTQRRVCINDEQYFEPVAAEVWGFHVGGYQVCQKWLKDRKGRELGYDDITHYRQVVTALGETIRLMGEIDAAIESWPIE